MNNFSVILFAIILIAVSSETLRGSEVNIESDSQDKLPRSRHRRQLKPGITCLLYLEEIEFQTERESVEEWVCMLPEEEASALGMQFVEIDKSTSIIKGAKSGQSTITLNSAVIDTEEAKMYIPMDGHVEVRNLSHDDPRARRNLAAKTGTLTALVIRVADSKGVAPGASVAQLENDVFDDLSCLKSQMEACSYGKLKIEPFVGITETDVEVKHGVVDVQMPDYDVVANGKRGGLQQAAMAAATEQLGNLQSDRYDIILLVLPPGSGDWTAYAYSNGKWSFYNDMSASSVSVQMHEVGHNLGLAHSGEDNLEYQDKTGMMGISFSSDDLMMCFNPAKNYQLGWYSDKVETINPLSTSGSAVRRFTLNGVADYKNNDDGLIVLRLEQLGLEQDYYIGYNRQVGINEDTAEDKNMVTIVRKEFGTPMEYGKSMKVAKLFSGQSFTIENFNNERSVEIKFVGLANTDGDPSDPIRDAIIEVIDVDNRPVDEDDIFGPKVACANYTFEMTTDNYPGDNNFFIVADSAVGEIFAEGVPMTESFTTYSTEVCLPYDKKYKFVLYDQYEDGICCGQGKGSYRGLDPKGNIIFSSSGVPEGFDVKIEYFEVGVNPFVVPTAQQTQIPTFSPTVAPNPSPTDVPTKVPTGSPTKAATSSPTVSPTKSVTGSPTGSPTKYPTEPPTGSPTKYPTEPPTGSPTKYSTEPPTGSPTLSATESPTVSPTLAPSFKVTQAPSTRSPTRPPSMNPTKTPTATPTKSPTRDPTLSPTFPPTSSPTPDLVEVGLDCEDRKGRFKVKNKGRRKKRNCKWVRKKNRCNKTFEGKPLWEYCRASCKRCTD